MQDRPSAFELLQAVQAFLAEQVVPVLEGTRQFHTRVAVNVLAIVAREIALGDEALRTEWRRLGVLLREPEASMPESGAALTAAVQARNARLAARIRDGEADSGPWGAEVLAYLRATCVERLAIANPKYATPRDRG